MPGSDKKAGRSPRVSDGDLLEEFRNSPDPVLSTGEVAEAVPIKRRGVLNRLRSLEEHGDLESKTIGGRNTVWWLVESGRESRENPVDRTPDRSPTGGAPRDSTTDKRDAPEKIADAVERVAEGWDDDPDRLGARKAAARAVLEYAKEHGTVSKQEAKEEVYPESPVEGQNPRTWYRKNVRPVLNEAAEYDKSARAYRADLDE